AGGVAALLLNLLVSGGISFPSVAQPMWVLIALALNALPRAGFVWQPRHWAAAVLPVPLAATLAVSYFLLVFSPITSASTLENEARRNARPYLSWRGLMEPERARPVLTALASTPQGGLPALMSWPPLVPAFQNQARRHEQKAKDLLFKPI